MTTITYDGGPVITPSLVDVSSVTASSSSRVVSHEILDGPPVHTLRPASPARGKIKLVFYSETDARDCFAAHQVAAVFTMTSADRALLNLRYVVTDDIDIALDETATHWAITFRYEQVI